MSVQNGQKVSAEICNAAFPSRTVDTSLAGVVDFTNTTESTSLLTGAVKVLGGVAVTKNLNVGGAIGAPTGNIADVNATTVDVTTLNATDANIADDLIVSGDTTAQAIDAISVVTDSLTVNNDSLISGDSTVAGELNVTGDSNLSVVNASDINATGDVVIDGDLTVNGTTTTVNSTTLEVTDANITINNGGNDASAQGAGLTVERTTVDGAIQYDSALTSKFKLGNVGSLKEVVTVSDAQEITTKTYVQPAVKEEASTPSAPSPGYWKIYPKSDGYYQQDNLGNETRLEPLSAGSSQKGIIDLATQILGDKSKIVQDMIGGTTDVDSSTIGSDQSVASLKTMVKFTNASLASINRIEHPPGFAHSFIKVLTFSTGSNVVIKHNAGSPASHRIFTQNGLDKTVSNGTSLFVMYDEDTQAWRIVGESGGGSAPSLPTQTVLTTGSGTYNTPVGCTRLKIRMVGGGGGGIGSGSVAGTSPGAGGNTTFGSSLLTANGGAIGALGSDGGIGGVGTVSSPAFGFVVTGGDGQGYNSAAGAVAFGGAPGGDAPFFGGGGKKGTTSAPGSDAYAPGGGGQGGGNDANPAVYSGSGGGAGAFIEATINAPSASYSYAVGSGGAAGGAGTSGFAGGAGFNGIIIIDEEYY